MISRSISRRARKHGEGAINRHRGAHVAFGPNGISVPNLIVTQRAQRHGNVIASKAEYFSKWETHETARLYRGVGQRGSGMATRCARPEVSFADRRGSWPRLP